MKNDCVGYLSIKRVIQVGKTTFTICIGAHVVAAAVIVAVVVVAVH